jgi:chemotaxis regulatin CheY-phosphate phosphatase CheZ
MDLEKSITSQNQLKIEEQTHGILESFIQMLYRTIPILDHIKDSIEETSSRIPRASKHLSTVTRVTESATMAILNVVDSMNEKLDTVAREVDQWAHATLRQMSMLKAISMDIEGLERKPGFEQLSSNIKTLIQDYQRSGEYDVPARIHQYLGDVKNDSLNIAMSLQVQDITAQQITAVSQLIESVRMRLLYVLEHFESEKSPDEHNLVSLDGIHGENADDHLLDAAASISEATERQNDADEIIAEWYKMNTTI